VKPVDPVCGMKLKKDQIHSSIDYMGKTYYFCCETCEKEFRKDPSRYVKGEKRKGGCH